MSYDIDSERDLYAHLSRHGIKRWLLEGAREEDANTIRRAIERMSPQRLARRLARALARG